MESHNVEVVILGGENSVEEKYQQKYGLSPGHLLGFVNNNTIYVEGSKHEGYYEKFPNSSQGLTEDDFNFRIARDTLLHELGHYINEENGSKKSDSLEFFDIYYSEVNNFTNTSEYKIDNLQIDTNIGNTEEYFATSFSCFISYPDSLRMYCPRTFEYFRKIMLNYDKQYIIEGNLTR